MTVSESSTFPDHDLSYCHDAVQDVSRTFALTIDLLESPLADQICVGYLLCRIADTIEDAAHIPSTVQTTLLGSYDAVLDPTDRTTVLDFQAVVEPWLPRNTTDEMYSTADWSVVANAPIVVATFETFDRRIQSAMLPSVREMIRGMITFIERYRDHEGLRIGTETELKRYCHYVAGTVGTLITNLLVHHDVSTTQERILTTNAEHFGRLLQFVNIAKDVHDDYIHENNVYLPQAWLTDEGVPQDALLADENRQATARVVTRLTRCAKSYQPPTRAYIEAMPLQGGNTIAAWAVPYLLAVGTLREIERNPIDTLTDTPVKLSREEVGAIVATVTNRGHKAISELQRTVSQTPYRQAISRTEE
ncbi:phytoene/squalene synthase family protein [Haladaptatus sp. SPP-AMP-3]|uniref:phytoene/squalene synthase family protein n=1 Tax=Haladaptatus sp. SPP-AMP-3 TaxID=3121295 RepID=UPI003C2DFBBF